MREEALRVIPRLRKLGFGRVVLLTGDNAATAANAEAQLDIDDVHSSSLPEDKTEIIHKFKSDGSRVVMVRDGINDARSPQRTPEFRCKAARI